MKRLKRRTISLMLVMALVLSMFDMAFAAPAYAQSSDSADVNEWKQIIEVNPAFVDTSNEDEVVDKIKIDLDKMEDDLGTVQMPETSDIEVNDLEDGSAVRFHNHVYNNAPTFYLDTVGEAADYMKGFVKKKEKSIRVILKLGDKDPNSVPYDILDKVVAHNGDPVGGDYIFYSQEGWGCNYAVTYIDDVLCIVIDYVFYYLNNADQENKLDAACVKLLDSLSLKGCSNYEKLSKIYEYVCSKISYDEEHSDDYLPKYTAYAALVNKSAVCQGYATLMYRLLLKCGINNRIVTHTNEYNPAENHAWNMVQMGDKYYFIDATWDAAPPNANKDFFLKTKKFFDTVGGHDLDGEFLTTSFKNKYTFGTSNYISSCEHSFGATVVVTPAKCNAMGTTKKKCSECGFIDYIVLNPTKHNFPSGTYTVDKKPTCTKVGRKTIHCTKCSQKRNGMLIPSMGHDYRVTIVPASKTDAGSKKEACKTCGKVLSKNTIPRIKSIKLSTKEYVYSGTRKRPSVTAKNIEDKIIGTANYTVSYQTGRIKVGKYKVTIKFKNRYKGTLYRYFIINPKGVSLNHVYRKANGFKAVWSKRITQTSGYQIRYSRKSNMSNSTKLTISNNTTLSKKVTGLRSNTKYYVQVRTYRNVNGTKYYSSWSKKKDVTTK